MLFRDGFDANTRGKVFSKEEIRDVATGYYGRLESGNYGVKCIDVVEAFIELDRGESGRRSENRGFPLCG